MIFEATIGMLHSNSNNQNIKMTGDDWMSLLYSICCSIAISNWGIKESMRQTAVVDPRGEGNVVFFSSFFKIRPVQLVGSHDPPELENQGLRKMKKGNGNSNKT